MKITNCSSTSSSSTIHNSLATLFFCIIIFCFYSFLYVQPWQHNHVKIVTINPTITINKTTIITDEVHDDLLSPPRNATVEQRIAWFKPRLENSKILESTARTRKFHNKIMAFLSQGNDNNNNTRCKVNFFMTWVSPKKLFGKRELLSLESIFNAHPLGCVVILSKSMDSEPGRRTLKPLMTQGYRVLPVAPDFHVLFNNTSAKGWLERLEAGLIDPGIIPITQNLANLVRLVALYKYGGVYLDTDVVILKDVSSLKNSIGIQTMEDKAMNRWTTLNNAVMIFDKEHPILLKFIEEFAYSFNGNKWGFNGPFLVTRVIYRRNRDKKIKVNVLPPMTFYPVNWTQIRQYFRTPIDMNEIARDQEQLNQVDSMSYGIHLWNKDSRRFKIEEGSLIGKLISDHCIVCQGIYNS